MLRALAVRAPARQDPSRIWPSFCLSLFLGWLVSRRFPVSTRGAPQAFTGYLSIQAEIWVIESGETQLLAYWRLIWGIL